MGELENLYGLDSYLEADVKQIVNLARETYEEIEEKGAWQKVQHFGQHVHARFF